MTRLAEWFESKGWTPFPFQLETWRRFAAGESGLVHAPTGMGKTHAAWGGPLGEAADDDETPPIRVLWITPLRALANDTVDSLREPVDDLGVPWTVELRTGDTPSALRRRQQERLPTALVTTPESLSILMSYAGTRRRFASLRCVVVDEWHELLGSKRGVQTELCLAHLRAIAPRLRTWGLSATVGNLDEARTALLGPESAGALVRGEIDKRIEIDTLAPDDVRRFPWAGHLGTVMLPQVVERIASARSTLLFTNTRSQAETWFQKLILARPDWIGTIALHHGSIDHEHRIKVETMLRAGELRCVVCTSSLDLGVDFSPVDQVVQVGSPKGVARLMQRAGRSGHQPGAVSTVVGVPTNALELIEFAAARDAIETGRIESRRTPERSLDVLVQHLVTLSMGDGFAPEAALEETRGTASYSALGDEEWSWAMDFVGRGGAALEAYPQYARVVERDGRHVVASRAIARLHRMSIGTITGESAIRVRFERGATLGTIEEAFIARLSPGDRFVMAGRVVELKRVRDMTAYVKRVSSPRGIVPRWMGGRSPLSTRLADAVRHKLDQAAGGRFDHEMALVRPLLELQTRWSRIPRVDELLVEQASGRDGHHAFVFTLAGRLANEGLASLVAYRIGRLGPRTMTMNGNDWGIAIQSRQPLDLDEAAWREVLDEANLLEDLIGCLNTVELARRRFRGIARIAGLVFAGYPGQGKTARQLQASSDLFYDVLSEFDPSNLLLDQARREVLERELEVDRLARTLRLIAEQRVLIVPTPRLTPLAFPLWADRMRTQQISTERWLDRVERMALSLESAAEREAVAS